MITLLSLRSVATASKQPRDDKCKQSKVGNGVGLTFFGFPRPINLLRVNSYRIIVKVQFQTEKKFRITVNINKLKTYLHYVKGIK